MIFMMLAPLLVTILALDPASPAPAQDFASSLDHAEISDAGGEAQIVGYDAAGEVIGTVALWVDEREHIHVASDYVDGYGETVVIDDQVETEATLPADVLARRASLMVERLVVAPGQGPQEGWFTCAASVAVAIAGCSISNAGVILACPGGVALAVCQCAPVLKIEVKACDL